MHKAHKRTVTVGTANCQNLASQSRLSNVLFINSALGLSGNNLILYLFPFSFSNFLRVSEYGSHEEVISRSGHRSNHTVC